MNDWINLNARSWVIPPPSAADYFNYFSSYLVMYVSHSDSDHARQDGDGGGSMAGLYMPNPWFDADVAVHLTDLRTGLLDWFNHGKKVLAKTAEFETSLELEVSAHWLLRSLRHGTPTYAPRCSPTADQVDQIVRSAQDERSTLAFAYVSLIDFIHGTGGFVAAAQERRVRNTCSRISRIITLLVRLIFSGIAVFCGVCWSARIFFLLHGSRPPRSLSLASLSPSIGGALA